MTGVVFIATNLLLAYFGWRFQDRPGAVAEYWHDNPKLEWTWSLITAGILAMFLFSALSLWAKVQSAPPADAMLIEVTGQQFAWNVRYPGPDGRLGRTDHAGMTIESWFVPGQAGDLDLACAEHCGLGDYRMGGAAHVVPAADFDKALTEAASQ